MTITSATIPAAAPARTVWIAGASGLVGSALLRQLLADPGVAVVHALGRRLPGVTHPKLRGHVVDFGKRLPALPAPDEAYLALGTTIRVAGSQAAFRAVDFSANLAVARAAAASGACRIGVVSAMGADAASRVFYTRTKGELEDAVAALGFATAVFARPSLLAGARRALGQSARPAERAMLAVLRVLGPLVPRNYRAIDASRVAQALLHAVATRDGPVVLLSGAMQD